MKPLSLQDIQPVIRSYAGLSQAEAEAKAARMEQAQPYLKAYLMAVEKFFDDKEAPGRLFMIGTMLWDILATANPGMRQVTAEELKAATQRNLAFAKAAPGASEAEETARIQSLWHHYNQEPLLRLLFSALKVNRESLPEQGVERAALEWLYLKSVIDCLDQ